MRLLLPVLVLVIVVGGAAMSYAGPVLISEVLADPAGKDDGFVFVEIHGPPTLSLDTYVLLARNGSGGGITHEVSLAGFQIPADGFLVIADSKSGVTGVGGADVVVDDFDLQNGPDSILLICNGLIVDALAYGSFGASHLAFGEGAPMATGSSGWSLARRFANVDSGDNALDFVLNDMPTPGLGEISLPAPDPNPTPAPVSGPSVPEPGSAALLLLGVLALALRRRW
jgi:PEP-CTERM motif